MIMVLHAKTKLRNARCATMITSESGDVMAATAWSVPVLLRNVIAVE